MAVKRWGNGMPVGWKGRARKRGASIKQIRQKQKRVNTRANGTVRKYKPYAPGQNNRRKSPAIGRSYNRSLGRGRKKSQF